MTVEQSEQNTQTSAAAEPSGSKPPFFIIGVHRSGTTLLQRLLARALRRSPAEVVLTANSVEAEAAMAKRSAPVAVIADVVLSETENGLDVVEALGLMGGDAAVVFISGHDRRSLPELDRLPSDRYTFLSKPFSAKELRDAVAGTEAPA